MMFVTQEGEGFSGVWAGEYKKYGEKKGEQFSNMVYWIIKLHFLQLLEYVFTGLLSTVDEFDLRLNIENEMRPKPNFKFDFKRMC